MLQLMAWGAPGVAPRQIWPGGLEQANFPCVTMLNDDGTGTARFWVLKLLIQGLGGADTEKTLVETTVSAPGVFAQAFAVRPTGKPTAEPRRMLLLVNKGNASAAVTVPGAAGKRASWVDARAGYSAVPLGSGVVASSGTVTLGGFAVELIWM